MPLSVCFTFDFDAVSVWIGSMRQRTPSVISRGEFGVVGARRLLDILARREIRATWFIPGHTIDSFPGPCEAVVAAGHEVAHHNYCHEAPTALSPEEERTAVERGIASIRRLTGAAPKGYRSPAWDHSAVTISLLREFGFEYDSSLMAHDFEPYWARERDVAVPEEPFRPGKAVPLVEMPIDWTLDDWPYFGLNWNRGHVGLRTPSEVFEVWKAEFDYALANHPDGVFTLTTHPQIIGRGSRIAMFERLIEHIAQQPGIRFTTMYEAVAAWRERNPFPG